MFRTGETFHGNELSIQLQREPGQSPRDSYFNFIYQQLRENGEPAGIMVFTFEVTELVKARQALEQVREASARALGDATAG
ncbi:hypothetical protein [Hymenobacter siberiensis]|uniref:hypothetical protein n=1 Tax=Hymenobacter siberiensis TaxID=2848396 RepID=UPI001C1E1B2D|nr:hypothetical protein [Hymenobacter siberiensis]MBU6121213.1 hypothetical protein [Hymenobacter siberiensis]